MDGQEGSYPNLDGTDLECEMDDNSSLPIPSDEQNEENLFGEISSSSEDNLDEEIGEEDLNEIPIEGKTYLSHTEALRELIKKGEETFLHGWTIQDISGLLIQLTKHSHEERGVNIIAKIFEIPALKRLPILTCIKECKHINKVASEQRLRFNEMIEQSNRPEDIKIPLNFSTWQSLATRVKKSRAIGDNSPNAIAGFLSECSSEFMVETDQASPNYSSIYSTLSSMAHGYTIRGIRGIDAAVIFDIFEQMKQDVESISELKDFFKKMFEDAQMLPIDDFKLNDDVNEEDAMRLMNMLDFPPDLNIVSLLPSRSNSA